MSRAPLDAWLGQQWQRAADSMLLSVSRTDLVKQRPGFGQSIRPRTGSILASPVMADWNPEPDYFFHWFRDSALVMDALRSVFEAEHRPGELLGHFRDFVHFSLSLQRLDGSELIVDKAWRQASASEFLKFLRADPDLEAVRGAAVIAETRVNPDATLDISSWSRPQHDGAPLRALCVLRWAAAVQSDAELSGLVSTLALSDLAFTMRYWREPCFDIWEEDEGLHYYTLRVSAAALRAGAGWAERADKPELAVSYRSEARAIEMRLDEFWLEDAGYYRSRILSSGARSTKELDISVILAAIHCAGDADGNGIAHGAHDPRIHRTLARLDSLFREHYPINRGRGDSGPALGRYEGDHYFSGGAFYFSTLGAAELCFRAARGSERRQFWLDKGDAYLDTVREFTPSGGEMSEQFDQRTGEQTSARHLAWSYAAFISCVAAREAAMASA